jgi:epoxyqueuosine reductase
MRMARACCVKQGDRESGSRRARRRREDTGERMSAMWTAELRRWVEDEAKAVGFDVAGVAEVRGVADPGVMQGAERFEAWVEAGHAGEMEYLKRRDEAGTLLRSALQVAMPWARSVVVCAMNYNADAVRSVDAADVGAGWIARYAWSGRESEGGECVPTDYHDELLGRLRKIEAGLLARVECTTRSYVDTGPMVERSVTVEAGVGWIGKNMCVIRQGVGSWLLLAVIVTSLPMEEGTAGMLSVDRCGSCTRCIDACPTDALIGGREAGAAREMDASRCIAYLTIEKKGAIAEELREGMGRQVFGCDICQDVCPWNRRAPVGGGEGMQARGELVNPALEWLAGMDAKEFKRRFKGSPLERTGRKRLLRNVAIAMGNSGEERFLARLGEWSGGEDAVLAEVAEWARGRIVGGED